MMLKSPINNATNTIKRTINGNTNTMSGKVMIDLSNSKRIMMGGVGVESYNSRMSISTTTIPDPTPMKEDRRKQVQQQQQQQQQSSHRKSISTGDAVVDTKKKRKMVRFTSNLPTKATTTTILPSMLFPTTIVLTEEHCNELWYQKDELIEIKKEAKELISRREDNKNKNSNSNSNSNKNKNDSDNDTHDGLERFTRQRATWKRSSIHYILLAQKQVKEKQGVNLDQQQEYLHNVSIRCSTWAKEAAFEQGVKDYCSIHDPLASLFASTSTSSSDASTSSARKRRQDYPKDNTKEEEEEEVGKGQVQEQEKRRQKQEQHYDELIFGTTTSNNNKDNSNTKKKKMDCCDTSNNIHSKEDRLPFKKRRIMMTIEV